VSRNTVYLVTTTALLQEEKQWLAEKALAGRDGNSLHSWYMKMCRKVPGNTIHRNSPAIAFLQVEKRRRAVERSVKVFLAFVLVRMCVSESVFAAFTALTLIVVTLTLTPLSSTQPTTSETILVLAQLLEVSMHLTQHEI